MIHNLVPDYLTLSFIAFLKHFMYVITSFFTRKLDITLGDGFNAPNTNKNYNTLYGYTCRTIFETLILELRERKKDLVIATTPINHSSFQKIIVRHFAPENTYIINLKKTYNKIDPTSLMGKLEKNVDIILITHLFGNDLDTEGLAELKKKCNNCLVVEDRVLGGIYGDSYFSCDAVDIMLGSMGMDKKPISLGGGYIHFRKNINYKLF